MPVQPRVMTARKTCVLNSPVVNTGSVVKTGFNGFCVLGRKFGPVRQS